MRNKIISAVLCLGMILAVVLVSGAPPPNVALASENDWGFEIQPDVTKVGFNEDFTVNASVIRYSGASDSYVMYVQFNGTLLDVTGVDTPATLPNGKGPYLPVSPTWDNATGWVRAEYCKETGSSDINETFTFCTVHFHTGSVPGTSPLNFTTIDPVNTTTVMLGGTDYLNWTEVVNGTVMVGTPTLTVNVTPAGTGTVKADGTTLTSYPNTTNWSWDENVTLLAVNSTPGYGFVNWTGDVADPDAISTTVTMDDFTKNATANFAELPPEISPDPTSLTFNGNVGENVTNQTLDICNGGGYTLDWTANITGVNVTWLSMSPMNGTNLTADDCNSTQVAVNTTGLAEGTYNAVINITSTSPNVTNSPCLVNVTLNLGVPEISPSPTSLTFTTDEGENPADKTLEVCNSGTGTLDWELTDDAAWLSATPTSGSLGADDCEDVTVSVDASGLAAGDYSATITITGSPTKTVPVNLHIVSAMPELPVAPASLSASGLSISPQQVKPDQEVTISINVANRGGETGSYNAVLYINSVVEDSQSVSVAPGMTKNVIFMVSKSDAGVYDVLIAGQSGQFEVVSTGWFGGGLGTGGIVAIVVIVIVLIVALFFVLRGTRREV